MARIMPATRSGLGTPRVESFIVGKSQTLRAGDIVVLATEATTSYNVVRKLTYSDYTASSFGSGALGVVAYTAVTDSSGNALTQPTPSTATGLTVPAGSIPIYRVPQMAAALPTDPATGRMRVMVYVFEPGTMFWGALRTAYNDLSAVTVTESAYKGVGCGLWGQLSTNGLIWSSTTDCKDFGPALGGTYGKIMAINTADRNYNTSSTQCLVGFSMLAAYCQYTTAAVYGS